MDTDAGDFFLKSSGSSLKREGSDFGGLVSSDISLKQFLRLRRA